MACSLNLYLFATVFQLGYAVFLVFIDSKYVVTSLYVAFGISGTTH